MTRLYRLALVVVPDADVAGDLFIRARSEKHLLHLAAAWRRAQGLESMAPPFSLPELSPEQLEHADHLARRRRLRRRVLVTLGAVGAMAALALAALLVNRPAPQGLAAAAAFQGNALSTVRTTDDLTISVYKAEAFPGSVMVLWDLKGPDAANAIKEISSDLVLGRGVVRVKAAATETEVLRRDRVAVRSTFRVYVTTAVTAELRTTKGTRSRFETMQNFPIDRSAMSRTVTAVVHRDVFEGATSLTIKSISLDSLSTTVRYTGEGPAGSPLPSITSIAVQGSLTNRPGVRIEGPSRSLKPSAWRQEGDVYVQVFPAVPYGVTALTLAFSSSDEPLSIRSITLPSPLVRIDPPLESQSTLTVNLSSDEFVGSGQAYTTDAAGRTYPGSLVARSPAASEPGEQMNARFAWSFQFADLPPQAELVSVTFPHSFRRGNAFEVAVDLSGP